MVNRVRGRRGRRTAPSDRVGSSLRATGAAKLAAQGLQVLTFIIAARILGPYTYGEYSLIFAVTAFALLFNDAGLQAAIVYDDHPTEAKLSTVFWTNALLGLLLSGLIFAFAGPLCTALGQPTAAQPMAVAGISFVTSLSIVPTALLERSLRFGKLAVCELAAQAASSIFTIIAVRFGLGIYSLAISPIVATAALSLMLTGATGYRPRARPTVRDLRSLWRFSSGMFGFNVSNYFNRNLDNLALSKFSGPFSLGLYSRAYSLTMLPVSQVGLVVSRVLFPVLARKREDPASMRAEWTRVLRPVFALSLPLSVLMMLAAQDFVRLIFKPTWAPLSTVIVLLAAAAGPQIVCAGFGCVFQAVGRTRLLFGLTALQTVLMAVGVGLGVHDGANGVAVGVGAARFLYAVAPVTIAARLLGMSARELASCLAPAIALSIMVGSVGLGASIALNAFQVDQPLVRLVIILGLSGAVYLAGVVRSGSGRQSWRAIPQSPVSVD